MKILEIILPIAVGALIGYCTNYIAIKMLFWPRKEWHVGKWRVPFTPGVIPKNKSRIAFAVANAVSEQLLTENDIAEGIRKSGIKDEVVDHITEFVMNETTSIKAMMNETCGEVDVTEATNRIGEILSEKLLNGIKRIDMKAVLSDISKSSFSGLFSNPVVGMLMRGNAADTVADKLTDAVADYVDTHGRDVLVPIVNQEIDGVMSGPLKNNLAQFDLDETSVRKILNTVIDRFMEDNISTLISHIKIKDIVEEKINQMEVKELENLVMAVMKNELQAVINLGAVIGAVIGIINIFI